MATIDDIYDLLVIVEGKVDVLQTDVDTIKAKTDLLTFTGTDVKATLDGEIVDSGGSSGTLNGDRFADFEESEYP